jgi:hypothetical protein
MARWHCVLVLAGLAAAGCGSSAEYVATENTQKVGPDLRAAYYKLNVGGNTIGDVRVWSPGGYKQDVGGEKERIVQAAMRIRNDSDQPVTLQLDHTYMEMVLEGNDFQTVQKPSRIVGETTVPPRSSQRVDLYFELPQGVDPKDVKGFALDWVMQTPTGLYSQSTPFSREQDQYRYGWYYPYYPSWYWYDPFWGPGWGRYW